MPYESRAARSALAVAAVALALASAAPVARAQAPADFVPVTDAMLQDPAPDDWLMWRRTLDGWGFRLGTWGNSLKKRLLELRPRTRSPRSAPRSESDDRGRWTTVADLRTLRLVGWGDGLRRTP